MVFCNSKLIIDENKLREEAVECEAAINVLVDFQVSVEKQSTRNIEIMLAES